MKNTAIRLDSSLFLLGGIGLGAVLMFILDPERGQTRRAQARTKASSAIQQARDLGNRTRELATGGTFLFGKAPMTDDELVAHIRSKLDYIISNPPAIQITANHGQVTLSGPILAKEVATLVELATKVPGVRQVNNHLTVYQNPSDIPSAQVQVVQAAAIG